MVDSDASGVPLSVTQTGTASRGAQYYQAGGSAVGAAQGVGSAVVGDPRRLAAGAGRPDRSGGRGRAAGAGADGHGLEPQEPLDRPVYHQLVPHCRALLGHVRPDADSPPLWFLAHQFGLYLQDQGDTGTAITYLARAAHSGHRLYGHDDLNTLAVRNNLAHAHQAVGDLGRAIPLYEAAVGDLERVLVPDHPDTLTTRNNLAGAYAAAGDPERAIPLYQATLADCERVFGAGHPRTRVVRRNLDIVSGPGPAEPAASDSPPCSGTSPKTDPSRRLPG